MEKTLVFKHVEDMVCSAIDSVLPVYRPDITHKIEYGNIFQGHNTLPNITARDFTFRTLHDIYGFSYREMSRLSGIGLRNVMRSVAKIRAFITNNPIHKAIKEEIDYRVTQGL